MAQTGYVDSHFHVWDLERFQYPWPTADQEPSLFRNFSPADLEEAAADTQVRHAVFVQVLNGSIEEAKWIGELAKDHPIIKGIVAGVDLTHPKVTDILDDLVKNVPLVVGVRHIIDFEPDPAGWIMDGNTMKGLETLQERGLTFDLLLRPHLLKLIPALVAKFPRLLFVVNHIAKPLMKDGVMAGWKEEIANIAKFPNVYCKISGLVTEADLDHWTVEDIRPYVKHVLEVFGVDRCMFGSDWPVLTLANATYRRVVEVAENLTDHLSREDKKKIFRENAIRFYKLRIN